MEESNVYLIEWVLSKPAPQAILSITLIGSLGLLAYGIFDGKPPILKETDLDSYGRQYCIRLGTILLAIFGLTLSIPIVYDSISDQELTIFVGDKPVGENTKFLAINAEGEKVDGDLSVRIGNNSTGKILLEGSQADIEVFVKPFSLVGQQLGNELVLKEGGEWRLYVANDVGKIFGPLEMKDAKNRKMMEIKTKNYANLIFPEHGEVTFSNTKIFYSEQGKTNVEQICVGCGIDFDRYEFDPGVKDIIQVYSKKKLVYAYLLNDSDVGKLTASGGKYDPNEYVGASSKIPLGAVLLVTDPARKGAKVRVTVLDKGPNELAISSSASKKLGFSPDIGQFQLHILLVDYLYKLAKSHDNISKK